MAPKPVQLLAATRRLACATWSARHACLLLARRSCSMRARTSPSHSSPLPRTPPRLRSDASPDRGFVKSRAHDQFSPGAEPRRTSPRLMVRLPSKLRGRFEATKGPVVRCGTLVLGRLLDGIFTYSAGRRRESELNPGKDQTGNRCTLVFPWEKTRNKQNECTTQRVHGCGPACVIAWKMVLRNTGG